MNENKKEIAKFSAEHPADFRCLRGSPLFHGMESDEINLFLGKMPCEHLAYNRGAVIIRQGDTPKRYGILLDGSVSMQAGYADDKSGQFMVYYPGDILGAIIVLSRIQMAVCPYRAEENSRILWIPWIDPATDGLDLPSVLYEKIKNNLTAANADEGIRLCLKSGILVHRAARSRVMGYLLAMSKLQRKQTIRLNMTREHLAAALCLDRTVLSTALMELYKDGVIDYQKQDGIWEFTIL
jgi:CRP-like cAMP-binding protein